MPAEKTPEEIEALKARLKAEQLERWKVLAESKRALPEKLREMIWTKVLPQFEHARRDWIERLGEIAPRVEAMTPEEAGSILHAPSAPEWWKVFKKLDAEVREACLPYLRKNQLIDGAFYRITCRNAHVGVWRVDEQGFEIPREKFGSNYLFVEYHWDNGPPFGTSRPWEQLEDLPEEALLDDGCRLRYMMWRNAEMRFEDDLRLHCRLSQWEPLPEEGSLEWAAGMEGVRAEYRRRREYQRSRGG